MYSAVYVLKILFQRQVLWNGAQMVLTRQRSLEMKDTSCLVLCVTGRHLEMEGAACWTNCTQEQLRIWAAWREASRDGGARQELSWWECPGLLLLNAWLKSKCLRCSWWWSAHGDGLLPSPWHLAAALSTQPCCTRAEPARCYLAQLSGGSK